MRCVLLYTEFQMYMVLFSKNQYVPEEIQSFNLTCTLNDDDLSSDVEVTHAIVSVGAIVLYITVEPDRYNAPTGKECGTPFHT